MSVDKKISERPALAPEDLDPATDLVTVVDASGNVTCKMTVADYMAAALGAAEIPGLPELSGGLGTLAAAFGQVERDHDQRIGALGASAQVTSAMISLFAALGQVSGQVNGGRAEFTGGSLSDPALRIGTVGIYSSAADTLSVAIAGTEIARFTSAGLTVYGTVTEA